MIVFPWREKFILKNFVESSFNEDKVASPNLELLQKLSSAEQYYLVKCYNWDDGVEVLKAIVESKKCDKGTALAIFWLSEPEFYINNTLETIPEYEREIFELLQLITDKINAKAFKKSKYRFDPGQRVNTIDWNKQYEGWNLSQELKDSHKGIEPVSLSSVLLSFFEWKRQRKLKAREAKKRAKQLKK